MMLDNALYVFNIKRNELGLFFLYGMACELLWSLVLLLA